jgi:hypothetical protein
MELAKQYCPQFYLHPKEKRSLIRLDKAGGTAPIYYRVDGDEITFVLVFIKDDGVSICGKQAGGHDFDVEFVRVLMKEGRVYYSAHSSDQGTWTDEQKPEKAYVSLGTHAIYPKPGCVPRIFGFGNDWPSMGGWGKANALSTHLEPMPPMDELQKVWPDWDSFMQWSYSTKDLRNATWGYRLFYPLSKYIKDFEKHTQKVMPRARV